MIKAIMSERRVLQDILQAKTTVFPSFLPWRLQSGLLPPLATRYSPIDSVTVTRRSGQKRESMNLMVAQSQHRSGLMNLRLGMKADVATSITET